MRMKINTFIFALFVSFLMANCGASKNKVAVVLPEVKVDTVPAKPKKVEPVITAVQLKYGEILGTAPEEITNLKLYAFVDKWLNTPYRMGGENKEGIDCSAFAQHCYVDVYNYLLERTSFRMYDAKSTDKFIGQEFLKEGDILFFKKPRSSDKTITHVGIYLKNNKFVSASGYDGPENYRGVKISDLTEAWWQERFICAGRKPLSIYETEGQ